MWFDSDSREAQAHTEVAGEGHTAKLSHELIAAAASYEAAKAYEEHVRKHGKPVHHEGAVTMLAAVAGGYIDRVVETKGLDAFDKERAKHMAHQKVTEALVQSGEY